MAAFTRRHYDAIAKVLHNVDNALDDAGPTVEDAVMAKAGVHEVRYALVELFTEDNPNFNKDKFIDASVSDEVQSLMRELGPT